MAGQGATWENAIARRRGRLIELLRKAAEPNEVLAEAMAAIEELDQLHRAALPRHVHGDVGDNALAATHRDRSAKRPSATRFVVDRTRRGLFLTEHFSSARQPFRCPEQVYDAAVRTMHSVRTPTPFEDILAAIRKSTGQSLPDYLVRVCIRYWLSTTPPLIEKVHARYRPVRPTQFGRDARRAWRQLTMRVE